MDLADRSYPVLVGPGTRHEAARFVPPGARSAVIVTQEPIREAGWIEGLDPGVPAEVCIIPDGEDAKTLATVEELARFFARAGLSRSDVVVAVGGGIVTDVAGFAAATYHRGTAYVNVATSLLAQVDAAIGGKTGVNLPEGKNLVGAFWQPNAVLCDTETLASLPPREWACGRGEIAKYAFLGDAPRADQPIEEQVARCAGIKAAVVSEDEREGGRRVILNYGHTLAHALEGAALARPRLGPAPRRGRGHRAPVRRRAGTASRSHRRGPRRPSTGRSSPASTSRPASRPAPTPQSCSRS